MVDRIPSAQRKNFDDATGVTEDEAWAEAVKRWPKDPWIGLGSDNDPPQMLYKVGAGKITKGVGVSWQEAFKDADKP